MQITDQALQTAEVGQLNVPRHASISEQYRAFSNPHRQAVAAHSQRGICIAIMAVTAHLTNSPQACSRCLQMHIPCAHALRLRMSHSRTCPLPLVLLLCDVIRAAAGVHPARQHCIDADAPWGQAGSLRMRQAQQPGLGSSVALQQLQLQVQQCAQ
jgi:hypothetical protein